MYLVTALLLTIQRRSRRYESWATIVRVPDERVFFSDVRRRMCDVDVGWGSEGALPIDDTFQFAWLSRLGDKNITSVWILVIHSYYEPTILIVDGCIKL